MDKPALRGVLEKLAPWTVDPSFGPAAVDAGECDRCGLQPRLVQTCGAQPWARVCRDCLLELGTDLFCAGHRDDGREYLARARALPDDWATITRLAWISTGEVHADPDWVALVADRSRRAPLVATLRD